MRRGLAIVIVGFVLGVVGFSLLSADSGNINERGRIKLPVEGDAIDANGVGTGYEGYCEADAVVLLKGDSVEEIRQVGNRPVRIGEKVSRVSIDYSFTPVYRDSEGALREGCAPESAESYKPAD